PAAVGWAALLIVFFARGTTAGEQLLAADEHTMERRTQAARAEDSVRQAEQRVQRLAASLAALSATAAQAGQNRHMPRQPGETAARLDRAGQWLIGARAARDASQRQVADASGTQPDRFPRPGPKARRVA